MNKYWKSGDPFVWLTGVALMFNLLMIAGLMYLIAAKGLGFFWPSDIAEVKLKDQLGPWLVRSRTFSPR